MQTGAVKLSEAGGLLPNEKYIQFCHDGKWHSLCTGGGTWSRVEANVVCRQLGLSGQSMRYKLYMSLNYNYDHQEPIKEVVQHQQLIHPTLCLVTHPVLEGKAALESAEFIPVHVIKRIVEQDG